jgi:hypothetical protein
MKNLNHLLIGIATCLFLTSTAMAFQPFPDTGQTMCYDESHNAVPCGTIQPGDPLYGQDAHYQPRLPKSYAKLGHGGVILPDEALHVDDGGPWIMTRDNVTGLIWELKTDANKEVSTNWQYAQNIFIPELNSDEFGGFSDWRLPTVKELSSLVNTASSPYIDLLWFPKNRSWPYWSSTDFPPISGNKWVVTFSSGHVYSTDPSPLFGCHMRAVRSGPTSISNYVDNLDGTVTDTVTGLMWQKCSYGQTWSDGECTGSPTYMTWKQALQATENLTWAGYEDWRMPNRNELQSMVDYSRYPAIHPVFEPSSLNYFTSTTFPGNTNYTWRVRQSDGAIYSYCPKSDSYVMRAVRGGDAVQCTYSITPTWGGRIFSQGWSGTVRVTTSHGLCPWNAQSNDPWLSIMSGSSGMGSGDVDWTADFNPGSLRTGSLTIAGKTFSVDQVGEGFCSYDLDPVSDSLPNEGGSGTVRVTTPDSECSWNAQSNDPWLSVTSGSSGMGSGDVDWTAEANPGEVRTGTLTIAEHRLRVTQGAFIEDGHGNTIVTATPINPNSSTQAQVDPSGDNDFFRVDVPAAGTLTVYTTGSTDTFGYLLDDHGTIVYSDDDGGSGGNFLITQQVTAGTYYVRVRHYSSSGTGPYTLVSEYTEMDAGITLPPLMQLAKGIAEYFGDTIKNFFQNEYNVNRKWLVFLSAGLDPGEVLTFGFTSFGPGGSGTISFDLADITEITPEGRGNDGFITTWIELGGTLFKLAVHTPLVVLGASPIEFLPEEPDPKRQFSTSILEGSGGLFGFEVGSWTTDHTGGSFFSGDLKVETEIGLSAGNVGFTLHRFEIKRTALYALLLDSLDNGLLSKVSAESYQVADTFMSTVIQIFFDSLHERDFGSARRFTSGDDGQSSRDQAAIEYFLVRDIDGFYREFNETVFHPAFSPYSAPLSVRSVSGKKSNYYVKIASIPQGWQIGEVMEDSSIDWTAGDGKKISFSLAPYADQKIILKLAPSYDASYQGSIEIQLYRDRRILKDIFLDEKTFDVYVMY